MKKQSWATFIVSIIGIGTYLYHLWIAPPAAIALWSVATGCAIYCIYTGVIHRHLITASDADSAAMRGMLTAAVLMSCFVLLGITLSAIFLFQ